MPASHDSPRTPAPLRKLTHLLAVALGWAGFVWLWRLVAAEPWESRGLVWLILGSLLVAPLLTGLWVLHNRSLYRRKGERRAVAAVDMTYRQDWRGRQVQADWHTLRDSRMVLISIEGDRKRYQGMRAADAAAAPPAARPMVVATRAPLR